MFVHILSLSLLYGQDDKLIMISSAGSRIQQAQGRMINYRPVYQHKGSTLSADSGYIYQDTTQRTFFEGFGRVIITQPNGTVVYADKLHYTEDTQVAILTHNVRMIDAQSVLTTNYLTYNMRSSVGTYTGGGRIVNETDTITSQNAYYFDNTQDAYFRHNVVVRTPNTQIYTDTMRYNTASKMVYFYGPTNIKGEEGQNLYTESGEYNTVTEHAEFGKNNLYTEGSKFLKGDSLYYDGDSGNGRAVHNVVYIDTADTYQMTGGLGLYNKANESITMTRHPLVLMVTKENEEPPASPLEKDSLAMAEGAPLLTDTLAAANTLALDSLSADSLGNSPPLVDSVRTDTIYMTADTLFSQLIPLNDYIPMVFQLDRDGGAIDEGVDFDDYGDFGEEAWAEDDTLGLIGDTTATDSTHVILPDSTHATTPPDEHIIALDLSRDVVTDTLQVSQEERMAAKENIVAEALSRRAQTVPLTAGRDILERTLAADSVLRAHAPIPQGHEVDSLMEQAIAATMRGPTADSLAADSMAVDSTSTTRIIRAYNNVRLFKSDLQAVADSAYYGYPDSMMRFFGNPMVWAQGSQMSSDTMYMQIVDEKLDNLLLYGNAFLVNTEQDSTKFNQIKGRKITGFFTDNELDRLFVDGNAESIYYTMDSENIRYQDMYHNRSSRIKLLVEDNEIVRFIPIRSIEGKFSPLHLVTQDAEILDGFIWKPGDRPTSREDLLMRKREATAESLETDSTDTLPETGRPTAVAATLDIEADAGDRLPDSDLSPADTTIKAINTQPLDTAESGIPTQHPRPTETPKDSTVVADSILQRQSKPLDSAAHKLPPDTNAVEKPIPENKSAQQRSLHNGPQHPKHVEKQYPWIRIEVLSFMGAGNQGIQAIPAWTEEQDRGKPQKEQRGELVFVKHLPIVDGYNHHHRKHQGNSG